jgi:probable HAF family extracellular repeat protein
MRLTTIAGVALCSLVLAACDSVENPASPETQTVRLHLAGALNITMTDLGTLGGNLSSATAINRWGTVVGYSRTATGATHAFRWDAGVMQDLTPATGTFSDGLFSRAVDINDVGQIVGTARLSGAGECEQFGPISNGCRAFRSDGTTMQDLGTLGGDFSAGVAINELGHVLGFSTTVTGATHAFYWDGATMWDVGTLGGDRSFPRDLNDRGRVVGQSTTASGETHAFVWNYQTKVIRDLGTLGGSRSGATAINNRGEIAGAAYTSDEKPHAFSWDGWTMKDLGTIDGGEESAALAINRWGDVVGFANSRPGGIGDPHPFIWNASHGLRDLGTLGGTDGQANAINNLTEVVGHAALNGNSCTAVSDCHAFFWDGVMHDLGTLVPPGPGVRDQSTAVDLNMRGEVVGVSLTSDEHTHAVLWKVRY